MTDKLDGLTSDIEVENKVRLQAIFLECFSEGKITKLNNAYLLTGWYNNRAYLANERLTPAENLLAGVW